MAQAVREIRDAFPFDANESADSDGDGTGDNADTTLTIDFSDMDYQRNAEVDFTKPGYEVVTFTQQSGTIPLGQRELTTGSLYTSSSYVGNDDLESTRQYDNEYTFISTSDSSVTISKELDVNYYYHGDLSDSSDMDTTQLGVHGYTKIVYGNNSGELTQLNTPAHALDPE